MNTFDLFVDTNPTDLSIDRLIDLEFVVKKDWTHGGGFTGNINITNNGNFLQGWTIEFDADFDIYKIWNAEIVSHVGNRYVIKSRPGNSDVNIGETVTFGFNALVDHQTIVEPNNFIFNQQTVFSPQAIAVGFEQHDANTNYDLSMQRKDWNATWMNDSLMKDYAIITDTDAYSGEKSLRITYLSEMRTGGSAIWKLPAEKEYYLSYQVKFSDDFDFDGSKKSGGKLPGLAGAGGYCSGGQTCTGDNGFSSRYMWGKNGRAKLYLYHMDKPTKWGENFWFQGSDGNDKYFQQGQWHNLVQRVRINDGNQANGEIDVWMDGEQVLSIDELRFVTNNQGIDALLFSTFHGGNTDEWLPDHTVYSYWDDFIVSPNAADVGLVL
ncbi:MAG: polysaccharide lyase [Xenococcaceae cyanobacterium]